MFKKIIVLLSTIVVISSLTFADTNGVWILAKDVRSGTLASDEGGGTFTFTSAPQFSSLAPTPTCKLLTITSNGTLDCTTESDTLESVTIKGNSANRALSFTQFLDLNDNAYYVDPNQNTVLNNVYIRYLESTILKLPSLTSCSGRLTTDNTGLITCTNNINDADYDPNNEKPIAGTGILVTDRTVSVDTNTIQKRIQNDCTSGKYVYGVDSNGNLKCSNLPAGSSWTKLTGSSVTLKEFCEYKVRAIRIFTTHSIYREFYPIMKSGERDSATYGATDLYFSKQQLYPICRSLPTREFPFVLNQANIANIVDPNVAGTAGQVIGPSVSDSQCRWTLEVYEKC
jgi:hypothetical protein